MTTETKHTELKKISAGRYWLQHNGESFIITREKSGWIARSDSNRFDYSDPLPSRAAAIRWAAQS